MGEELKVVMSIIGVILEDVLNKGLEEKVVNVWRKKMCVVRLGWGVGFWSFLN